MNNNNQNFLEFDALLCNDLSSCNYMTDVMLEGMFSIIRKCRTRGSKTESLADGKLLMQMFFLKCLSFKRLLGGVGYRQVVGNEHYELPPIIDHPTLFSLARSLYEAFCAFELLYVIPDSEEKKMVLHNLFIMQGLNERQGYYHCLGHEEQKENEKEQIEECRQEIKATALYKSRGRFKRH